MRKLIWVLVEVYAVLAILLAYFLLNLGFMEQTNLEYYFLNFTGALGIMAVSLTKNAYQPLVLNLFWATIAIIGFVQTFL